MAKAALAAGSGMSCLVASPMARAIDSPRTLIGRRLGVVPRLRSLTKASDCVVATIFSIVGIDLSSMTTSHSTEHQR